MKLRKGYRVVFLAVFVISLLAEVLLFLFSQVNNINSIFRDDFKIIFIKSESNKFSVEKIKTDLEELKGVREVVYVARDKRIDEFKESGSDFSEIVTLLGKNPIPDTFEVALKESVLGDLESWLERAWKLDGIADIKYRPLEAYVILHTLFYSHFIFISFILTLVSLMIMAIMVLTYKFSPQRMLDDIKKEARWFLAGSLGAFLAVFSCYAIVYPIKYLSPIWSWPNPLWHVLILLFGGFTGWIIHQWKVTH